MSRWRPLEAQRLRQVGKVVLATFLAYALTLGQRNEFALFSALGAAMVVGGSLGEDLKASLNRVRGTLAATAVGIAIAYLLGASIWSLSLGVAAVAWVCLALDWGAPAMRIGLAMALVVLAMHGTDPAHYALWRAFNTLIGVAVGLAVGRLVWPVRARDQLVRAIDGALAATAETLETLADGAEQEAMRTRLVQVHDALAAIRAARQDARLEQRVHGDSALPIPEGQLAARAAIGTLGASVGSEELARAGARDPARLAATAADFAARHERAVQAIAVSDRDPREQRVLVGLINDLEQIHAALAALGEARSRGVGATA